MKLGSKNVRLIDALYQLQLALIIGLAYAAFAWIIYSSKPELRELKESVKNLTEQVEKSTNKVESLDRMIQQEMRNPEKWPLLNDQMKALSPLP